MKPNFNDKQVFFELEEKAIDGQLDYENFPAPEYRYFSKLSKLGYKNRHNGWSKEICEQKQHEFKIEYKGCKERFERFFKAACRMQENIKRGEVMTWSINKARNDKDKLKYSLQALELILCESGFSKRNGGASPDTSGCEYCSGIVEWEEKLTVSGQKVKFNFCPVCGRLLEEQR